MADGCLRKQEKRILFLESCFNYLFVCLFVYRGHIWRSEDNLWSPFSYSTMWVRGIKLRLKGFTY